MPIALSTVSSRAILAMMNQDPFADQPQTGQDPFADRPQTTTDPFADQPQTTTDPFADQPQTGPDPFEDPAALQQAPKHQSRQLPAKAELTADQHQQTTATESHKAQADKESSSETGVPITKTQPNFATKTFPNFDLDLQYLLPSLLLIPIILGWLWMRSRKNRAFKIQQYRQPQPDPFALQANGQRFPARRKAVLPPRNKPQPVPEKPPVSSRPERFKSGVPSGEELEITLTESGEELHLGDLSAISDRDSEEFDFGADSGLELESETSSEAVRASIPAG